eukprot:COSAG01_NODE_7307_length_3257_cov_72.077581_2_plen_198_part_00
MGAGSSTGSTPRSSQSHSHADHQSQSQHSGSPTSSLVATEEGVATDGSGGTLSSGGGGGTPKRSSGSSGNMPLRHVRTLSSPNLSSQGAPFATAVVAFGAAAVPEISSPTSSQGGQLHVLTTEQQPEDANSLRMRRGARSSLSEDALATTTQATAPAVQPALPQEVQSKPQPELNITVVCVVILTLMWLTAMIMYLR